MSTGEHVEEHVKSRRASERRSSLTQIEEMKVRRASERRRSSVELSAELLWRHLRTGRRVHLLRACQRYSGAA